MPRLRISTLTLGIRQLQGALELPGEGHVRTEAEARGGGAAEGHDSQLPLGLVPQDGLEAQTRIDGPQHRGAIGAAGRLESREVDLLVLQARGLEVVGSDARQPQPALDGGQQQRGHQQRGADQGEVRQRRRPPPGLLLPGHSLFGVRHRDQSKPSYSISRSDRSPASGPIGRSLPRNAQRSIPEDDVRVSPRATRRVTRREAVPQGKSNILGLSRCGSDTFASGRPYPHRDHDTQIPPRGIPGWVLDVPRHTAR